MIKPSTPNRAHINVYIYYVDKIRCLHIIVGGKLNVKALAIISFAKEKYRDNEGRETRYSLLIPTVNQQKILEKMSN